MIIMNKRELLTDKKYTKKGWSVLDKGAPDRVYFRTSKEGNIIDVEFVEIKSPSDELTIEQYAWQKILKFLGAKTKIEIIE